MIVAHFKMDRAGQIHPKRRIKVLHLAQLMINGFEKNSNISNNKCHVFKYSSKINKALTIQL